MEPHPNPYVAFKALRGGDDDYLSRARMLVERAIRRRWAEGLLTRDPDGLFTSVLGADHVERLLKPTVDAAGEGPLPDFELEEDSGLGDFVARMKLSPSEADLLAVLFAFETDPAIARLVAYLGGNQAQPSLTVDLLFEIVYRGRVRRPSAAAALMHGDLAPHRAPRRLKFILVDGTEHRGTLSQSLRLHPRMTGWLLGHTGLDAELAAHCQLYPPDEPVGECDPKLRTLAEAALREAGRLLLIEGPPRSGREMLVRFAAAPLGRPVLVVSGRGLPSEKLVAAFREAVLHGAVVVVREVADAFANDGLLRFRECIECYPSTVTLIGTGNNVSQFAMLRPTTTLHVSVPPFEERHRLWQTHLGDATDMSPDELRSVASLYNLGTAGIITASHAAVESASFERRPAHRSDIGHAVRQLFDADLSVVATRIEVSQTWDDVVLTDELGESVVSIIDRIRFRNDILGQWGFARKVGKGLGVTVLFSGEPGTGKSMVAGLMARELGLDLYIVDLARVVSKWLGETEKNLARAFDAAEAGHVLLLFDEADSILGKRSEVQNSNDRHANLETNFILARLEQFQGIAFFTTNLSSSIDPAIARRMSANVTFPFPDVEMRTELWRRMIPKEAPTQPDIDFVELATRYELSGGFIRNIVLRAAYTAIREGVGIGMSHLERAAQSEYTDRGSLVVGGRLV